MRFYLSAKWQMKDVVIQMRDKILSEGHSVPVDWTKRASEREYGEGNAAQSHRFSEEEMRAILDSDVFIHLSDMGGKGKYIDLGIALASNRLQCKPSRIYVVGKDADESQFYFNTAIRRIVVDNPVNSLERIFKEL